MLSSDRSLTIITIICLLIIGLAIAVRVSKMSDPARARVTTDAERKSAEAKLATEAAFFDNQELSNSSIIDAATASLNSVTASAYLVGNINTGKIYMEKNSFAALPIASMSKLMTALVALETLDSDEEITITEPMTQVFPDQSRLYAGETFKVKQLLYPLLLNSSNVAAEALASSSNRIRFVEAMNSYAWEVGLPQSFFADPSGLSHYNAAPARDFFALAQYLYRKRDDILALTRMVKTSVSTTTDHGAHDFVNIHPFVNDHRFIGGKTGRTTEAGETMLTILRIEREPIAFIVLGSAMGKRGEDTKILVERVQELISE